MPENGVTVVGVVLLVVSAVGLAPKIGLLWRWRRRCRQTERVLIEDALRHIREFDERGLRATRESIAGSLDISRRRALDLTRNMEQRGVIDHDGSSIALTPRGVAMAVELTRAHRVWESYLVDEVGLGLEQVHNIAHQREHTTTPGETDRLEARLGFPHFDPHGDLIPSTDGREEEPSAFTLAEWPIGQRAVISHIEDEEPSILGQILAEGLAPGSVLEVLERDERGTRVRIEHGGCWLAPVLAANINVDAAPSERDTSLVRLSVLEPGKPERSSRSNLVV